MQITLSQHRITITYTFHAYIVATQKTNENYVVVVNIPNSVEC